MPANRTEGSDDRFAPPGDHQDVTLDVAESGPRGRPTGTMADDGQLHVPEARRPVKYKQHGGFGNLLVWLIGGACLMGAAGFGAVAASRMLGKGQGTGPSTTTVTTAPVAGQQEVAPAKPVIWKPVTTGDAVLVTVEATPRSARLLLDGAPTQSNPIRVPRGGTHTVQAMADGFEPASAEVVADGAKTIRLKLKKSRR
jgi:hypothetical protein